MEGGGPAMSAGADTTIVFRFLWRVAIATVSSRIKSRFFELNFLLDFKKKFKLLRDGLPVESCSSKVRTRV
jgi:hypothetical protein